MARHWLALWAILVLSGTSVSAQTLAFNERAAVVGLVHSHAGTTGMQFMAPGGAVGDFNGDGAPDVFAVGGSLGVDRLFINQGNGTFVEQASAWGITGVHGGSGATVGDFDDDGDLDLYVTSFGTSPTFSGNQSRLYRNNGNGTFTNVAQAAGVRDTRRLGSTMGDAFSPTFDDYDRDGDLDLAVAGWLGGNQLFRNNGDGTFTNVTTSVIAFDMTTVRGFTPKFVDINHDLLPELLWVGDFYTSKLLLHQPNGTFADITATAGVGLDTNGMGSAAGDFDGDGLVDWYVTSRISYDLGDGVGNMLYINQGDQTFAEVSAASGVNDGGWGWGSRAADFDHDGRLDIVATNGWDDLDHQYDETRLFLNNGDGTFTDRAITCGMMHNGQGRGLATLDADMDGDVDVIIFGNNEPLRYFENQLTGPNAHWLTLKFDTSLRDDLAPDGFGVVVDVETSGSIQHLVMDGGSNFLANSELGVHVGLGANAQADVVTVTWPNGEQTVLNNVPADQFLTVFAPALPCPADFAPPAGVLDFFDVAGFLAAFSGHQPAADLAPPIGVFDFFDVSAYLSAFSAGCP